MSLSTCRYAIFFRRRLKKLVNAPRIESTGGVNGVNRVNNGVTQGHEHDDASGKEELSFSPMHTSTRATRATHGASSLSSHHHGNPEQPVILELDSTNTQGKHKPVGRSMLQSQPMNLPPPVEVSEQRMSFLKSVYTGTDKDFEVCVAGLTKRYFAYCFARRSGEWAAPKKLYDICANHLQSTKELYASPLNATFMDYHSADPLDSIFGAKPHVRNGSVDLSHVSAVAYPPFDYSVLYDTVNSVQSAVTQAQGPSRVLLIVPIPQDQTIRFWKVLNDPKHSSVFSLIHRFEPGTLQFRGPAETWVKGWNTKSAPYKVGIALYLCENTLASHTGQSQKTSSQESLIHLSSGRRVRTVAVIHAARSFTKEAVRRLRRRLQSPWSLPLTPVRHHRPQSYQCRLNHQTQLLSCNRGQIQQ